MFYKLILRNGGQPSYANHAESDCLFIQWKHWLGQLSFRDNIVMNRWKVTFVCMCEANETLIYTILYYTTKYFTENFIYPISK